jgi:DNA polymerase-3 subunit delta'
MIDALVLHSHTKQHVAQFIETPVHALLLVGGAGMGKTHVAEAMLTAILQQQPGKLLSNPYVTVIRSEKDSISIDAIRELQRFLQLKTIGTKPLRRAVIVEHADTLTTEAQNAFLKLLEEPPADTLMILTANNQRALLPTILSRVQSIAMHAPEEVAVKAYFTDQGKDAATVTQAYFLSGGMPGLMAALLDDSASHPLLAGVATAKTVLQKQLFERLALVESLSKQKDEAKAMVQALQYIAQAGLNGGATKADPAKIKQWHHILKATTEASTALDKNANTKLVLSNLMLTL